MHANANPLTGPDFIGQLAERQLQNGLELDAAALRENERAWQQDLQRIGELAAANDHLREELDAANARLAEIRRQATVHG